MQTFYGSNAGTCESLAQTLAAEASSRGYDAVVKPLDAGVGNIKKYQPVAIVVSSYEGEPPDNAAHFMEWLKGLKGNRLEGMKHAVFGCGHRKYDSSRCYPH